MATSGNIGSIQFNALKVVDVAFRKCRLLPQNVTAEMQSYALNALHLLLSSLGNPRPPSWCVDSVVLAMEFGNPIIELPVGTVAPLNVNYRRLSQIEPANIDYSDPLNIVVTFSTAVTPTSVGLYWGVANGNSTADSVAFSSDGVLLGTQEEVTLTAPGKRVWTDLRQQAMTELTISITSAASDWSLDDIWIGNNPNSIPMGELNRDSYVDQNNAVFPGQPNSYWFQRKYPLQRLNVWPAPNAAATLHQIVVWRQRHVMDVTTLRQALEIPQRWMEAIEYALALRLAEETPQVDLQVLGYLRTRVAETMKDAWDGDDDGAPSFIQPYISPYTYSGR